MFVGIFRFAMGSKDYSVWYGVFFDSVFPTYCTGWSKITVSGEVKKFKKADGPGYFWDLKI